ncbi:L-threonine 3-dehydrogenase [Lacrimispora sp. NSJ-141]|uniref:L-threonine 3-dehydrogenase n=1 Tax=Lientehia hominis TaxID=2897778 RepID=A0AAP2RJ83_9FIRM|nr:L-threonine 3-dehydrogenase [Lientehia hominis]MCD2492982.1 L-threonine 3-dehydrogenase [Lientehia hominis]
MRALLKTEEKPGAYCCENIPVPEIAENEVLVKVHAAAICGTDMHIYDWTAYAQERLKLPMVFGHEFAGEIVSLGSQVSGYAIGDRVAGETHIPCGHCVQCRTGNQHICENMKIIGVQAPGAFAEYIPVHKDCLWRLDDSMDYETGALLEPMGVGVHGVLSGEIGGKTALILGCGPIGLCAVGAAKASGASLVIAADVIDRKMEEAKKLGADHTINTREQDLKASVMKLTGGRGVDVVVDYTGNERAIQGGFEALRKGGRFTFVGLANGPVSLDINDAVIYKEAKVNGVTGRLMYQTWYDCEALIKSGRFDVKKIIGGVFDLKDYEEAFAALKGGAPGKMLLIP